MQLNEHTLIPYDPDWSHAIKHQHTQRTSLAEGITGLEERAAWFARPRLSTRYTITTDSAERTAVVEGTLRSTLESAKAAVPLWGREQIIASASGSTITLERPAGNVKAGQCVGVAKPYGDIRATAQVTSVSGNTILLNATLAAAAGDLLVPL